MRRWLAGHGRGIESAIRRLLRNPLSTTANVLVIGAAVSLPLVGLVAVRSLERVAGEVAGRPALNVFMALDASRPDLARIEGLAKGTAGVTGVRFISKEAALERLKGVEGLGEAIGTLRTNPLPDAFIVELDAGRAAEGDQIVSRLRSAEKVAFVQWDGALHRRVETILGIGRMVLAAFGALLGVALVAVTFNTVRLQILGAVEEIAVSRLVGATDGYIRRPFCYYGMLLGALGGAAGLGLTSLLVDLLGEQIGRLATDFGSTFQIGGLLNADLGFAIGIAAALGLFGAYMSVSSHLRSTLRPV